MKGRTPRYPHVLLALSLLAATACTATPDGTALPDNAPTVTDVSGREPVPTIHLMTKTAANDPSRFEMARMIVEAWQEAGIPAKLLPLDDAQLNSRTFTGKDFDAFIVSYGPTPERLDPDNLLSRFYSANATDSGSNVSLFRSEEFDEAYLAQGRAVDFDSRQKAVEEAQRILYEDVPVVPVVYPEVGAAYRSDQWRGIEPAVGYPVFNVWNATNATAIDGSDSLVVGTTFDPPTLNPVVAETLESQIPLSLVYDTLLAIGPDGKTVERAAEDIRVDGKTVRLTLREGMTFSDGRRVTGDDVAFSVKYLREHKAPLYAAGLESVSAVEVDGRTVKIVLNTPAAHFADVSLTQMPILPRHVWTRIADPSNFGNKRPVGSGPFTFSRRSLGASLTLSSNRRHYDPPSVSRLELSILGNFEAGISALTSGEIDIYDDVQPATQYQSLRKVDGVTVIETQSHGWRGLHFNTTRKPFDDRQVRSALASLIPFEDLIDVVMEGAAKPGGSVIAPSLERWHNADLKPFTFDPAAAMATLAKAGYAFGPDGRLYFPEDRRGSATPVSGA